MTTLYIPPLIVGTERALEPIPLREVILINATLVLLSAIIMGAIYLAQRRRGQ